MAKVSPKHKWRFAIGTTSRVPDSGGLHYLIADFDGQQPNWNFVLAGVNNAIIQTTRHGWHLYTDEKMPLHELVNFLKAIKADPAWIEIGKDRGYFFLADKSRICFPWPVEYMVIHYGKKKT